MLKTSAYILVLILFETYGFLPGLVMFTNGFGNRELLKIMIVLSSDNPSLFFPIILILFFPGNKLIDFASNCVAEKSNP